MSPKLIALALIAAASVSIAQTRPAEPATQPAAAAIGSGDFPALRRRLVELQAIIDDLRAQLAAITKERDALLAAAAPAVPTGTRPANFEEAKRILVEKLKPGLKRDEVRKWIGEPDDVTRAGALIVETSKWQIGAEFRMIECHFDERGVLIAAFESSERVPRMPKTPVQIGGQAR